MAANEKEEDDVFNEDSRTPEQRQHADDEFIRQLANDYIHFKIYGNDPTNNRLVAEKKRTKKKAQRTLSQQEEKSLRKAKKVLRTSSMELERGNSQFFETVRTETKPETAKLAFRIVSKEVLERDKLNWGRIVSLFVYGGILAEEFWKQQQEDKVEEVETWLTESIAEREDWIDKQGGWDDFNETFTIGEDPTPYSWLIKPAIVAASVLLFAWLSRNIQT